MKLLFIDTLKTNQLTKKELRSIVAKGDTRIDGGPDTDGEENCLPPQGSSNNKGKYCADVPLK